MNEEYFERRSSRAGGTAAASIREEVESAGRRSGHDEAIRGGRGVRGAQLQAIGEPRRCDHPWLERWTARPTSGRSCPSVQVPTLVLHRTGRPVHEGWHEHGDGTRGAHPWGGACVELQGDDHVWSRGDDLSGGTRHVSWRRSTRSRSNSTESSARCCSPTSWSPPCGRPSLGDTGWRATSCDRHRPAVRARAIARYRGTRDQDGRGRVPRDVRRASRAIRCATAIAAGVRVNSASRFAPATAHRRAAGDRRRGRAASAVAIGAR